MLNRDTGTKDSTADSMASSRSKRYRIKHADNNSYNTYIVYNKAKEAKTEPKLVQSCLESLEEINQKSIEVY